MTEIVFFEEVPEIIIQGGVVDPHTGGFVIPKVDESFLIIDNIAFNTYHELACTKYTEDFVERLSRYIISKLSCFTVHELIHQVGEFHNECTTKEVERAMMSDTPLTTLLVEEEKV